MVKEHNILDLTTNVSSDSRLRMGWESQMYLLPFAWTDDLIVRLLISRGESITWVGSLSSSRYWCLDYLWAAAGGIVRALWSLPGHNRLIESSRTHQGCSFPKRGLNGYVAQTEGSCRHMGSRRRIMIGLDHLLGHKSQNCGRENTTGCATRIWSLMGKATHLYRV